MLAPALISKIYLEIFRCFQVASIKCIQRPQYCRVPSSTCFQGAVVIELIELWEGRDEYMKDHWNLLDVLALAFCGIAFLVRISDPDSLWGRALYGAAAPLLLFRTLFFVQFLPAQGPMIEVMMENHGDREVCSISCAHINVVIFSFQVGILI